MNKIREWWVWFRRGPRYTEELGRRYIDRGVDNLQLRQSRQRYFELYCAELKKRTELQEQLAKFIHEQVKKLEEGLRNNPTS